MLSNKTKLDKCEDWYDSLPKHIKQSLKNDPVWYDGDMWRAGLIGATIGFAIGVLVGFEWAWRPVVATFRPLIG
jgi:hypothetical protein